MPRGAQAQFLAPSTLAEDGHAELGAAPDLSRTGAPDPHHIPAPRGNQTLAAIAEAQEQEVRAKREVYERRMSSLVAQADPWKLGPQTKPRPMGLAKMSFYQKKPAPK